MYKYFIFFFFLLLNNISLFHSVSHFIYPFISQWTLGFTFWLLWIRLLWTFVYKFLYGHSFSILFDIYLGVKWLGYMVILFEELPNYFPQQLNILHSHQPYMLVPIFYPLSNNYYHMFFDYSYLVDVKWYLLVLIFVSLKTNGSKHIFMCWLDICVSSLEKFYF